MEKVLVSMPWSTNIVADYDSFVVEMAKNGLEVILDRSERRLSEDELVNYYPGIYAHVCGCDSVTDRALAAGDRLKIISRIGIGYDTIDVEAATKRGIAIATTPGSGAEAVAEYAFAMMLAQARRIVQSNTIVHKGEWHREAGPTLFRKTVGIIGFGNIGRMLARISSSAFDMKILAFDSYQDEEYAKTNNITYCALDDLIREADFISVHIPLTHSTRDLITARELAMMKKDAIIVNCARGGIINEQDLYEALLYKKIRGACLDVFDQEPINMNNPLLTLDNVYVSAHNAGSSLEGKNRVVWDAMKNVIDIHNGLIPKGVVNPEVL